MLPRLRTVQARNWRRPGRSATGAVVWTCSSSSSSQRKGECLLILLLLLQPSAKTDKTANVAGSISRRRRCCSQIQPRHPPPPAQTHILKGLRHGPSALGRRRGRVGVHRPAPRTELVVVLLSLHLAPSTALAGGRGVGGAGRWTAAVVHGPAGAAARARAWDQPLPAAEGDAGQVEDGLLYMHGAQVPPQRHRAGLAG